MPKLEHKDKRPASTVEPIRALVQQILNSLEKNENYKAELRDRVADQLKDSLVLDEFKRWLNDGEISAPWIELLKPETLKEAASAGAALDCLQVVVWAYLPGPRYFQGVYIYSKLHKPDKLRLLEESFRVPHLNGALGWMSASLLNQAKNNNDSHVVLYDAQFDLRGRVAIQDLWLGDRSVLGFPVSGTVDNKELGSISGFVFFSHPVPGVFPQPTAVETEMGKAFVSIRTMHEGALASAIESYILRRYSELILKGRKESKEMERSPLMTLSDDDPTGFLASVLFESDPAGTLSVECEINEDVLLETSAWYLRVATIYPEKWEPQFVKQLRRLAEEIKSTNIHHRVPPIVWYSIEEAHRVRKFYPPEILAEDVKDLVRLASDDPGFVMPDERPDGIRGALHDFIQIYKVASIHSRQFDLVIPIYSELGTSTTSLGFFRLNFDAFELRDAAKTENTFQKLWRTLKEVHNEINTNIAQLLLAFEEEQNTKLCNAQPSERRRPAEVQHIRLWIDVSYLLSEWLAKQIHRLVLRRMGISHQLPNMDKNLTDFEELIRFALKELSSPDGENQGNGKLEQEFDSCSKKWQELLEKPEELFNDIPEITFVSFWTPLKLPVITHLEHITPMKGSSAEVEFSNLLLTDPGLLRMLTILTLLLNPDEEVSLDASQRLSNNGWENVDFGVPTHGDISNLKVKRLDIETLSLDVTWQQQEQSRANSKRHRIRLQWDCENEDSHQRHFVRSVSSIPGVVARRLGKYIFAGLEVRLHTEGSDMLKDPSFDTNEYCDILKFIGSPTPGETQKRMGWLERLMLYQAVDDAGWRILPVKESPPAFLAALCNKRADRPAVLAFRDFALANARAFYIAREYDAQREAAEGYARNLSAIAHGYKGPILQLKLAVSDAGTLFWGNQDKVFISTEMEKLEKMIEKAAILAGDAIAYAWRKTPVSLEDYAWGDMHKEVETVILALDLPRNPKIEFKDDIDEDITVKSSPYLWRHLLSKLIGNALEYHQPEETKVLLHAKLDEDEHNIVLSISNSLTPEKLDLRSEPIRKSLTEGQPYLEKDFNEEGKSRGYGLIEAYNCCKYLDIEPRVEADKNTSQLVISLQMALTEEHE